MNDFRQSLINCTRHKVLKRQHYPLEVMLTWMGWYATYPLGNQNLPVLAAVLLRRKRPVGSSRRMDETYIRVSGQWKYHYRAVDRADDTVDFLPTAKRDLAEARRFLERAIKRITRPMLGFNSFWSARIVIAGIETMHMILKRKMNCPDGSTASAADQFYRLAF